MNKLKLLIGLLLVLTAVAAAYFFAGDGPRRNLLGSGEASVQVAVRYGSEKDGFLKDEAVVAILRDKYDLAVDGTKMGSLEMSEGDLSAVDALWPSSELAARVFEGRHPGLSKKVHNIFSTPIVLYSWPEVTDALMQAGIVEKRQNSYFVIDPKKLLGLIEAKTPWKDLGLPRQGGLVAIHSTDPTRSNSGFLLAGLLGVLLNDGEMVTPETLPTILPSLQALYARLGFLENSTGVLFDKYIKQGQGAFPLISAYESLIIEFYHAYPSYQQQIKDMVRVLTPEPTVWSEHPVIALTEPGNELLAALQDPELQAIAWQRYGFRSGVLGLDNDPAILNEIGLPERIDVVTPLPAPRVMEEVLEGLRP